MKISKKILEEYRKKTKEILSGLFNSIYSLQGLDFDSITEVNLNNAKFIHWPSTIKRQKLIYKLFKEDRIINIVLAIDEVLLENKYYFQTFLELKKELNKLESGSLKKYIFFLRLRKKILFGNFKLNYLEKIENLGEKNKIDEKSLTTLFNIKNSLILLFSDFLDIDIKKLKEIYVKKNSNCELINLIFLPPMDFYYLTNPFDVSNIREKIIEKTKNLNLRKYFV